MISVGNVVSLVADLHSCFAVVIFSGKHEQVTNLIHIFWCMVLIGVVHLINVGSKKVVFCFLYIDSNMLYDVVCGGIDRNWWD